MEDPEIVKWAVARYKDPHCSRDRRQGRVCGDQRLGRELQHRSLSQPLQKDMHKMGVANIIYTDISKDGMMEGPIWIRQEMIVKRNMDESDRLGRDQQS